jgi:hypothetical protein
MRNRFHRAVETLRFNLVSGTRWLLSARTIRLNHRHQLAGRVRLTTKTLACPDEFFHARSPLRPNRRAVLIGSEYGFAMGRWL